MTASKFLFAAAVSTAIVSFAATSAMAEDKPYVGLSIAGSSVSDVGFTNRRTTNTSSNTVGFDFGYGVNARVGHSFDEFRAEVELGYRKIDVDSIKAGTNAGGDVDALTAMVNGYYDIDAGSDFTPYVMAGIGVIKVDGDLSYTSLNSEAEAKSFDEVAPAGQVGLGFSYGVDKDVDLVAGYSFLAAPSDESGKDETVQVHSIQVGLNFSF